MEKDACFELGYVLKTHGLNGSVSVFLDVDFPEEYENLESVFIEVNKKLIPFFVETIHIAKGKANIKFEDIDQIEKAEQLKGCKLFLPLELLPKLEEGQFYYHQVINYQVWDEQKGLLGKIQSIYEMPNQDLIAMDFQGKEALIPVSDEIIEKVDHEAKIMYVKLPEGLLDIYLED
ncbi:ribosome maturation factor RimM [Xanthovirga aplysinae]|uniref:ribosome maturation factor RimM n=1 Tax=Xanthovirga aplysinae TaxID=2529853 RepID=UPI0012BD2398|nr:ribosome maturation factor RimM [Xanthovirga aplysinae]MTI31379.1 16S rRNA processing protein RimM [Xanthovirga aplysinae]